MVGAHQVYPRTRLSYNYGDIKIRRPYCLDCGGLPMLNTYIRKGAQGRNHFAIGYYCEYCDRWISELNWCEYQDGTFEGYALWSFSEKKPYFWMKREDFKQKMKELRLKKLEELKELRKKSEKDDPQIIPLIDRHIKKLTSLLRLSKPKKA